MTAPLSERTSAGQLDVVFGVDGWVMLRLENGATLQERARTPRELEALLGRAGLLDGEARALARSLWPRRPKDAGIPAADGWESARRGSGLSAATVFVLAVLLVVLLIWLAFDLRNEFP